MPKNTDNIQNSATEQEEPSPAIGATTPNRWANGNGRQNSALEGQCSVFGTHWSAVWQRHHILDCGEAGLELDRLDASLQNCVRALHVGFAKICGEVLGICDDQIGVLEKCCFRVGFGEDRLLLPFDLVSPLVDNGHALCDLGSAERFHLEGDKQLGFAGIQFCQMLFEIGKFVFRVPMVLRGYREDRINGIYE